ncbi:MAG: aminotransferase class I/II-fold pyridoxal phosphate-dependent enzyme [Lachnospiraceae bacterium]|nr:aminotransferase class I/II-fold pyridoxal phosphate-dependent enzyme [Lachnospiraceae bacterium]
MTAYKDLSREELESLKAQLNAVYKEYQGKGLKLNMARGKPSNEQLDLSMPMMDIFDSSADLTAEDGTDCRNYGVLDGIPEAKKLMADMIGVKPENVIVCGGSSLNIMYDMIARAFTHGVLGNTPWSQLEKVKFLCPVPGYDRHFAVTEFFGVEMINIPTYEDGPDMDLIEKLVSSDDSIKGLWCVPKYGNPSGVVYSEEVVKRMAALKPAAPDFRLFWDNAYGIHHLYFDDIQEIPEILSECAKAGNPDMVYEFCSTSKITFPGAGISAIASSDANIASIKSMMNWQIIGHDKINQLRHVRFFGDINGMMEQMKKHADIMRPKFEAVCNILEEELGGLEIGTWSTPKGGYFISFDSMDGCAKAIVAKCKDAGMVLTGAGATYPYKNDPKDSNIRIAPSFPTLEEIKEATRLFALCVKLASVEKLLEA